MHSQLGTVVCYAVALLRVFAVIVSMIGCFILWCALCLSIFLLSDRRNIAILLQVWLSPWRKKAALRLAHQDHPLPSSNNIEDLPASAPDAVPGQSSTRRRRIDTGYKIQ